MPTHVHELDASRDAEFLRQGRRDPLTQNQFEPGDEVVICADCKGAQYASTWHRNGGCADPHCDGNQTLSYLPEAGELDFTGSGTSTDAQLQVLQSDQGAPDSEDEPEAGPGQDGGRDEGGVVDRGRTRDAATNWPTVIIGLITVGLIGVVVLQLSPKNDNIQNKTIESYQDTRQEDKESYGEKENSRRRKNKKPIARPDEAKITRINTGNRIIIDVLKNDSDTNGDNLHIEEIKGGDLDIGLDFNVWIKDNKIVFSHGLDTGLKSFRYVAKDNYGGRDEAKVKMKVTPEP